MNEYDSNFEFPVIDDGTEFDWDSLFQPQESPVLVVLSQLNTRVKTEFWSLVFAAVW